MRARIWSRGINRLTLEDHTVKIQLISLNSKIPALGFAGLSSENQLVAADHKCTVGRHVVIGNAHHIVHEDNYYIMSALC